MYSTYYLSRDSHPESPGDLALPVKSNDLSLNSRCFLDGVPERDRLDTLDGEFPYGVPLYPLPRGKIIW